MRPIYTIAAMTATLLGLSTQADASSVSGYISKTAYTGSRVFVWVNSIRNGASCNTPGAGQRYELDGGNTLGQTQIALVLTAEALHQAIFISGTNSCSLIPSLSAILRPFHRVIYRHNYFIGITI